jgi:hypothetical protein
MVQAKKGAVVQVEDLYRLTENQQRALLRDGLRKILSLSEGKVTVGEVLNETNKLLQLPMIRVMDLLEPEFKATVTHWRKWRKDLEKL